MISLRATEWKQWAALGVAFALVVTQVASWWFNGRDQLARSAISEITELTREEIIVNSNCLAVVPPGIAGQLLAELSVEHKVWQEQDVPSDYYELLGHTGDGREHRAYRQGVRLCYSRFTSTPIYAKVEFSLFRSPFSARGYELRYVWILGKWIQLPVSNPTWRS